MQFTYELTEQDFIEAYRAHRNRKAFTKWSTRIFFWFMVSSAIFGLIAIAIVHNRQTTNELLPAVIFLLLWIALLWFFPQWHVRRQFRKQPAAHGSKTITLDADGVHSRWDGGSGDSAWKNYIRWLEGENQVLLYTSPFYYVIISTRGLDDAQRSEVRELLSRNIHNAN